MNISKGVASPRTRKSRPGQGATLQTRNDANGSSDAEGNGSGVAGQECEPFSVGHHGGDTDMAAATAVKAAARTYERMALSLVSSQPLTADEVHAAIERELKRTIPLYSIRPRLSALKRKGLVVDTGERRPSSQGPCLQRVLRAVTPQERILPGVK